MLLDRDDRSEIRGGADGRFVERGDRGHVDDPGAHAAVGETVGGLQRSRDHDPAGDDGDVASFTKRLGFADFEPGVVGARQLWNAKSSDAKEHRPFMRRGRLHGLSGLPRVRGRNDGEIGQEPQPGHVLDRVMGGPEFSVSDARRLPDELHVRIRVSHVGLDLLQGAGGEEARGGAHKRDLAAIGEPGADADHVLLGDADIDRALRPPLAEAAELGRSNAVVDDDHDPVVALGNLVERGGEGVAAIEQVG